MLKKIAVFSLLFLIANNSYAIETKAKQAYLIDAITGQVLFSKEAETKMAPSSMSKLMTCYVVFEALKNGDLTKDTKITISENAWKMQGSKTFVPVGGQVGVEDLIRGIIVQSGNDATVALAEGISGTEDEFANRINKKASELGMINSNFKNATGWPHPEHLTTAKDLALLAQRLINDFPEYYGYFAETEFTFNNIKQGNRNVLLTKNIGADGLKTGHTDSGGYGIVASAVKDNRRLILVINGLDNEKDRAQEAYSLLNYGFMNFTNIVIAKANAPILQIDTWLANEEKIDLVAKQDIIVTVPVEQKKLVAATVKYNSPVIAPIFSDKALASLNLTVNGLEQKFELYAQQDVQQVSFFQRLVSWLKCLFSTGSFVPKQVEENKALDL